MKYKFRGDYAEDLELGLRLIRDGHKLALLSSTRIIHSHNRPAYYYLKRGYVDNLFLLRFFPDHPALDGEVAAERVFYDIAFTYEVINSIVQKELPGVSLPCSVKELSTIVTERLRGAVKDRYPTFMKTVSNGFVDSKFAFFLQDLSDRYYLNGNINSRYNGVLVEAVLNAMKEILKYMGDTYELIDEHIIEDFKSCFYKAFAFKCGVYLANCFFHDSESTREKLKKINSELTKEV